MTVHSISTGNWIVESLPDEWVSSPFGQYLDIKMKTKGEETVFTLDFKEEYMGNPAIRAFHGGMVAALIETSAQICNQLERNEDFLQNAETLTVDYLRPSVEGTLTAIPRVIRSGKNISILGVDIFQEKKMVATGKVIFVVNSNKKE